MTLFELVAKLKLDTSEFDTDLQRANSSGAGLTSTLGGLISSSVALGSMLYDVGKQTVNMVGGFAVDLVETTAAVKAENAAFQSVFKENADAATAAFQRIADADDIYVTRLKAQGTSYYTQFLSGGADAATSLEMMETALNHAADASAFYDISLEDASYRLRSFLRGNIEAGEAIGLFANDVSRQAKATDLYGMKWSALNEAQRETVLLGIATDIYNQSEVTGQAAREMDGYVNQLGNLKEQWRQTMAILGEPVLEATIPALQALSDFLTNNPETVQALAEAFGDIAMALSNLAIDGLEWLTENSDKVVSTIEWISQYLGLTEPPDDTPTLNATREFLRNTGPGGMLADWAIGTFLIPGHVKEEEAPLSDEATKAIMDYIFAFDKSYDLGGMDTQATRARMRAGENLKQYLSDDEFNALAQSLKDSGIMRKDSVWRENEEETIPAEVLEALPQQIVDALTSAIPGAVAAGLDGAGVYLDGQYLIGYVSAGQARDVKTKTHTGRKSV